MKEYIAIDSPSNIRGLSLFNIHYEAGHTAHLLHGTPADTLLIVLSGRVKCLLPHSRELTLTPETVTLFTKEQERTSYYIEDTHLLSIHIDTKTTFFVSPAQFAIDEMNDFGRTCLTQLAQSIRSDTSIDDLAITSYVYGLLSVLAETSEPKVPERFAAIDAAKLAIEREFTSERPIPEYARDAAMSESCFRRLFTLYVGVPPIRYRQELRLEYVKLLVSSGECNLSEAAARAGFNSLPYLSRRFRQKYGCSVSEYLRGDGN